MLDEGEYVEEPRRSMRFVYLGWQSDETVRGVDACEELGRSIRLALFTNKREQRSDASKSLVASVKWTVGWQRNRWP